MVYDELSRVNPDTTTVEQVKILICTLNALLDTDVPEKTPRRLLKKPIFPVRYPSGEVELESGDTEFAIVDRRQLEQSFRDKVKILDFTRDEVHKLKAFLKWTKLGSRCLSKVTKEISIVQSELTYRLSDPTYDVRKKAYALTRYVFFLLRHADSVFKLNKLKVLTHFKSCGPSSKPAHLQQRPGLLQSDCRSANLGNGRDICTTHYGPR